MLAMLQHLCSLSSLVNAQSHAGAKGATGATGVASGAPGPVGCSNICTQTQSTYSLSSAYSTFTCGTMTIPASYGTNLNYQAILYSPAGCTPRVTVAQIGLGSGDFLRAYNSGGTQLQQWGGNSNIGTMTTYNVYNVAPGNAAYGSQSSSVRLNFNSDSSVSGTANTIIYFTW